MAPSYPYITYLFIAWIVFQLYLDARARAILFCALFINLIDVCI